MSYMRDEDGNVYYDAYESPSQAFTSEEWVIEKALLIAGLNLQIASLQNQINYTPQLIEILESYPDEVKSALEEHNLMIGETDVESLEAQILEKQTLLAEIEGL